jgi:hypothetical protein
MSKKKIWNFGLQLAGKKRVRQVEENTENTDHIERQDIANSPASSYYNPNSQDLFDSSSKISKSDSEDIFDDLMYAKYFYMNKGDYNTQPSYAETTQSSSSNLDLKEENEKLRQENVKLKSLVDQLKESADDYLIHENLKLKEENQELKFRLNLLEQSTQK